MLKEIRQVLKPSGRLICVTDTYVEATSIRAKGISDSYEGASQGWGVRLLA
jgi:hypothetical protein